MQEFYAAISWFDRAADSHGSLKVSSKTEQPL
jgi:hypothetical protein